MVYLLRHRIKRLKNGLIMIQHLNTLILWILLQLQFVFAFDEKNIENTYNGTGFVIARTSHTDMLHVLGRLKVAATAKVKLLRAYVGKPGDTVVDDHTDEEL